MFEVFLPEYVSIWEEKKPALSLFCLTAKASGYILGSVLLQLLVT